MNRVWNEIKMWVTINGGGSGMKFFKIIFGDDVVTVTDTVRTNLNL